MRRATDQTGGLVPARQFLSTLSLRRATNGHETTPYKAGISIHALLAESDANWFDLWGWAEYFYPRSPCGERLMYALIFAGSMLFLSTLSLRRATIALFDFPIVPAISIHALLAESDQELGKTIYIIITFLSTLSLRRATTWQRGSRITYVEFLSTLSLRRATSMGVTVLGIQHNFYPRSPCGERRGVILSLNTQQRFLSTLSLRRATTSQRQHHPNHQEFLSTLSLRRATFFTFFWLGFHANFYPRSPCGERLPSF